VTPRGGAFIAVASLVFALCLACGDDDEPKEPLRLEELSQRITDQLDGPVAQGTVSPADRQLFRANLGQTSNHGSVAGYIEDVSKDSVTVRAYPDLREIHVKVSGQTALIRGQSPIQLGDLEKGEMVFMVLQGPDLPAAVLKGMGVSAP
jgi:hypothetical protein